MSDFALAYGQRLRQARTNAEITQTALAKLLGVSRSSVANVEAGRQAQTAEAVVRVAELLKVSAGWLLTGGDFTPSPPIISRRWLTNLVEDLRASAENIEAGVLMDEARRGTAPSNTWPIPRANVPWLLDNAPEQLEAVYAASPYAQIIPWALARDEQRIKFMESYLNGSEK